jgi:hypothetical protein
MLTVHKFIVHQPPEKIHNSGHILRSEVEGIKIQDKVAIIYRKEPETNRPSPVIGTTAGSSVGLNTMDQEHSSGLSTSPAVTVMEIDSASVSKRQTTLVISLITYSTGITTFLAGVVTMAIPIITTDLHLPQNLILWYFKENIPLLRYYGQSLMVRALLI